MRFNTNELELHVTDLEQITSSTNHTSVNQNHKPSAYMLNIVPPRRRDLKRTDQVLIKRGSTSFRNLVPEDWPGNERAELQGSVKNGRFVAKPQIPVRCTPNLKNLVGNRACRHFFSFFFVLSKKNSRKRTAVTAMLRRVACIQSSTVCRTLNSAGCGGTTLRPRDRPSLVRYCTQQTGTSSAQHDVDWRAASKVMLTPFPLRRQLDVGSRS